MSRPLLLLDVQIQAAAWWSGSDRERRRAKLLGAHRTAAVSANLFNPGGLERAVSGHEAVADLATYIPRLTARQAARFLTNRTRSCPSPS
jgi:hypothetical protein